ncbi:MAG: hypothetical protein JW719_06760 [Pirellulales bacterium]|nr:hypothetical protein [Pirellulales bacterium]
MKTIHIMLATSLFVLAGCGGGEPEPLPPEMQQAAVPAPLKIETTTQTQPPAAAPIANQSSTTPPAPVASTPAETPPAQPATPPPGPAAAVSSAHRPGADDQWATEADAKAVRQKAGVGMGAQGHGYGNDPLTYPLASYFRVRERIGVDQIKHAMDLYKALNGHFPRTQDEFRKEIIKANAIRLPVLPDGDKFFYDPDQGELMVIPARQ